MTALQLQASIAALPDAAIFALSAGGFAALYFSFALGSLLLTRRVLPALGIGRVLNPRPLPEGQLRREVRLSLISVAIFGLFGVLTRAAEARGWVQLRWEFSGPGLLLDLMVMTLWNELHFYACHRLLHTPWLFKHVHLEHHRALVPTPFSAFAFHWFEAVLLGSVMITALPFYRLSILGVLCYPAVSLAANCLGHLNYDPVVGLALEHPLSASRRHGLHHRKASGNYGFFLPWLDALLGTRVKAGDPDHG